MLSPSSLSGSRPPEPHAEPPERRTLFFAVQLDSAAAEDASWLGHNLKRRENLFGGVTRRDRLHVTLRFVAGSAELPTEIVEAAVQAAGAVWMQAFDVQFDRVLSFGRAPKGGPLVLCGGEGVAGLYFLHQAIDEAVVGAGLPRMGLSFTPHVTLIYRSAVVPEQPIEPIRWTVREFVLVNSHVGRTRHEILGRWKLQS